MAVPVSNPKAQFFDNNGDPLAGGKLYSYDAGTSTPKSTYTTSGGTIANANPAVLDSAGRGDIWLGTGTYKLVLKTSADVEVWTVDNVAGNIAAGFGGAIYSLSSTTTITSTYQNALLICTGTITLNLLSAASATAGFAFIVFNNGTGTITIDPSSSETIGGASTLSVYPGESVMVDCDGTGWQALFKEKAPAVSSKTANYTVTLADRGSYINCDATSASFTLTLPAASTVGAGYELTAKKTDSSTNTITIDGNASETIDGSLTAVLGRQNETITIYCDGSNWRIRNRNDQGFGVETTIASGTTTDLGTIYSRNASITGTTTITSFGSSASTASPMYMIKFTGALTLTHNGTSLIIPGAANITTAAGDTATVEYLGSGNWRVRSYQRANGQAIVYTAPALTLSYTSSDQTITSAGSLTLAHSLGVIPKIIELYLVCQSADLNYSSGDVVQIQAGIQATTASTGVSIVPDATNINVRYGSNATVFYLVNKTTGATNSTITANSSWKLRVIAYA